MNNNTVSSDLIRGHIDTIILRSLYFGDRYGYDIIKEIEQKTDGEYKLKQPTLYSCLKRLEDQGFTSSYWGAKSMGGRKKYYTLTEMGRQLFIKNQSDWQRSRQIIEKLIEGEEFEINAGRPRVFEKALDETPDLSEQIFDTTALNPETANNTTNNTIDNSSTYVTGLKTTHAGEATEYTYKNTSTAIDDMTRSITNGTIDDTKNSAAGNMTSESESEVAATISTMLGGQETPQSKSDFNNSALSDSTNSFNTTEETSFEQSSFEEKLFEQESFEQNFETERFDNFSTIDESESEEEMCYDNFEASYEANPELFKQQEHYDNFSGYVPPSPDPYKPAIFIREETEEDIAARKAYLAAEEMREKTDFTKSSYELDQSGEFVKEFGIQSDVNELDSTHSSAETLYFDQKDKPSYLDDVSKEQYSPSPAQESECGDYLFDDELPYAEHLLKEYGADLSAHKSISDTSNTVSNNTTIERTENSTAKNGLYEECLYKNQYEGGQKNSFEKAIDETNESTTAKQIETSDVNELPYESPNESFGNTYDNDKYDSTKTTGDSYAAAGKETSDVNELPYSPATQNNEEEGDDGIELPQSFKETEKEDEITKGFLKYDSSALSEINDEEIVSRQYHSALSRLIKEQKPRYSPDPFVQNKLEKTAATAAQMGDEMIIRKHSDTIKEYNSENYYYSNRLKLWHYGILFVIMLLETALTFTICELFVHQGVITKPDLWIYIFGILFSLALPTLAFILAQINLNKRKKCDHDFKSLKIFRFFLCALFFLIIFLVNSYLGILTNNFTDYLASLIYPMVLTTNIVTSGFIFKRLFKSKRFNCQ